MKKIISCILAVTMLCCSAVAFADEKEVVIDTEVPVFDDLSDNTSYKNSKDVYIADLSPVHYIVLRKDNSKSTTFQFTNSQDELITKTFNGYSEIGKDHNISCADEFIKIYSATSAGSYMVYATDIYGHDIAVRFTIKSSSDGDSGGGGGSGGGDNTPIKIRQPYANGEPENTRGNLIAGEKIKLSSDTGNVKIYYTTDGTTPTSKSNLYNSEKGIILTEGQILKAIAIKKEMSSDISEWKCIVAPTEKPQIGDSVVKGALETEDHSVYMTGYPDETFGPNKNMTRAEVATMFARLMKEKMDADAVYESSFADVTPDAWYYNYVGYMEKFGIITGYEDGTFRPQNTITRAEFVTMASRFATISQEYECDFTDVTTKHWAYEYIAFAAENGWVGGYEDNTFRADNTITRAEVVTIVNNMLVRSADESYVNPNKASLTLFADVDATHWAYYDIIEATNEHTYSVSGNKEKWNE